MIAGLILGLVEGGLVISGGRTDAWVLAYGAIAYTLFFALAGTGAGAFFSWAKRFLKLEAAAESSAFGAISGLLVAGAGFGIGLFRIRRDVFHEELALVSVRGLGVALACALAAAVLFAALWQTLRLVTETRAMRWLLRTWGGPALAGAVIAVLVPVTLSIGAPARAALPPVMRSAPEGSGNVLVIVVDTLRADHLPSYGYETGHTPNLDAFARDAIRFDQAFANASWTRPSFASILSGRYASSHGVMAKTDALPGDLTTLAEAYREAGWHTEGVVTNYNVGPYFNFDQGFDSYHYLSPDFVLGADDSAAKLLLVQFLRQRIETLRDRALGVQPGTAYQDASVVNREVLSAIEHAPGDRPWMMFVGYMDPHDPYYAHPYDGEAYSRAAHPNPTPDEAEHLTALYDGEITFWDEHFGALVAELRRRGLYEDMTIVVTADHGEEFCEHGGFFHGTTLYDEQVHVPLFVKLPASRRGGTVVRHWVQSIDIMPTLLRESRVEVPAGVQGASLFEGSDRLFAEESHEGNVLQAVRERRGTDEIKLITANEGNPRRLPSTELFRVDLDPGEQENLADTDAATLEHARRALEAAHVRAGEGAVEGQEVELDDASRRQLCELGYLTGESCEE
jgi:arylsulfatase A-like enzyme